MSSGVVGLCIWLTANSSLLFCADATPEMASIVTAASNPWPILRAALPVRNSLLQLIFTSFSFFDSGRAIALSFVLSFERSEEHTSELQSRRDLVCRLL